MYVTHVMEELSSDRGKMRTRGWWPVSFRVVAFGDVKRARPSLKIEEY